MFGNKGPSSTHINWFIGLTQFAREIRQEVVSGFIDADDAFFVK